MLLNTRGFKGVNNNCFLNCLVIALFCYNKSPFYSVLKDTKLKEIIIQMINDLLPDLTPLRNSFPDSLKYGQQDFLETFDYFMKYLGYEPMEITIRRESKNEGDIYYGSKISRNVSYINLDNTGKEDIDPIKDLFFPEEWEDLGLCRDNYVQNASNEPEYRFTRNRLLSVKGDCLIFYVNRGHSNYRRHRNKIKIPLFIDNGKKSYFRFASVMHISTNTEYGHYVLVLFDKENHYKYDDSLGVKIINNKIDYDSNKEFIERNSVMYFYYLK
jgi:hypothetical protein